MAKIKTAETKDVLVFDFGKKSVLISHIGTGVSGRPQIISVSKVVFSEEASTEEKKEALRAKLPSFDPKNPPEVKVTWEEGMVFRQVLLPDMPDADLKKAFQWEMKEKYFLNEDENLIGSECAVNLEHPDGVKEKFFSVFYCDKKTAMERIALVSGLGLPVSALVPGQAALARILGNFEEPDKDLLVCDIGFANARILALHQKKNVLSRTVLLGGQALTEMMTGSFTEGDQRRQFSAQEAEEIKVSEGCQNPQASFIGLVRPYLDKMAVEIKRSVDYYEGQKYAKPISKVLFSGGGSDLKGLTGFMKSFLGIPVEMPDPREFLSAQMAEDQKKAAEKEFGSLLASLGAADFDAGSPLNLLPQEIKFKDREKKKMMSLRIAAFMSIIVVSYLAVTTFYELRVIRSQIRTAAVQLKEISRVIDFLGTIASQDRVMRSALKNDLSHPAFFKTLSVLTPEGVTVEEMTFVREKNSFLLTGSMNASGRTNVKIIAQFISDLQKTPFFKEVTLVRTFKDKASETGEEASAKDSMLKFELKCQTKGLL